MNTTLEARISAEFAAFLEGPVSLSAATCGADRIPHLARALGCRWSPDLRLTVFLIRPQAEDLLADLARSGKLAVVASEPATHRAWQFKGGDAREVPLAPGDPARIRAYVEAFIAAVRPLGYPEHLLRALFAAPRGLDAPWAAVQVTPAEVFQQTPGPAAGEPLGVAP